MLMAVGAHPVARPGLTDSCYHYRPSPVSLTGRLIRRTLPGPPNYQSIARGDRPQVVDLLILETPICTIPDYKDSPNTDAFHGQDTVQVRRAESTWRDVGRWTARRVAMTGTRAGRAPGPHRVSAPTGENESAVSLDALADSIYFVKLWPKMGFFSAHSGMERMDPTEARTGIAGARMVPSTWPGTPMRAQQ